MKMYSASFETLFWRFNLMMALVIFPFVVGLPFLAILAVPVFLSALMGVSFKKSISSQAKEKTIKYPNLNPTIEIARAA